MMKKMLKNHVETNNNCESDRRGWWDNSIKNYDIYFFVEYEELFELLLLTNIFL